MKTLTELIGEARGRHDIRDVLGLGNSEKVIVCPLPQHVHKHNTPSFSIFSRRGMQWWRCHGSCDEEGDVVDLVGFLRVMGYDKRDPDKIRTAVALLDDRYQIVIPQPEPEVRLRGSEHMQYLPLGPEALAYALTRGLSEDTIKKYRLGQYEHFLTMPCFEEGVLKGIKMRNLWQGDEKKRFWQLEGSRLGLFGWDNVAYKTGVIFVVKGEIPVMLMDQIGFSQVCAPTGGEGSGRKEVQRWTEILALSTKIVIGDNDGPGKTLAQNRSILFGSALYFPPEKYKDIDAFILAEPKAAYELLRSWKVEAERSW